jgi:hypothetical protein
LEPVTVPVAPRNCSFIAIVLFVQLTGSVYT